MDYVICGLTVLSFIAALVIVWITLKDLPLKMLEISNQEATPEPGAGTTPQENLKWKAFCRILLKSVLYLIAPVLVTLVSCIFNDYFSYAAQINPFTGAIFAVAVCFFGFYFLFYKYGKKYEIITDKWDFLIHPGGIYGAVLTVETSFVSACAVYAALCMLGI